MTALRAMFGRMLRHENRRAVIRRGRIERIDGFESKILDNRRRITVYLPPGYDDDREHRYPVLYMQDGQNLFDAERAYILGQHWRLDEAADAAVGERAAQPMIIVGVDHAGVGRLDEYTPSRDPKHKGGGRADDYACMLIEELMPFIDERFRTAHHASGAAIGGSSLGALVSLYIVLKHRRYFSRAIAMSASVWWNDRYILREVKAYDGPPPRLWIDIGWREGDGALADVRALHDAIVAKGWSADWFRYYEDRRGDHSERAWARRVRPALEFLFPPA